MEKQLVLEADAMRLTLDPERGGSIRDLSWRGQPLLRPAPADTGMPPLEMACFPLVPYANRIAGGQFVFAGREVGLAANWNQDPNPIHGQAWLRPWHAASVTRHAAELLFQGGGDEWPWAYECRQYFQLRPNSLLVDLSIRNLSATDMPTVLGLHPYFPDAEHARMVTALTNVWTTDPSALPLEEIATPPEWSFRAGRAVRDVPLDNSFTGWDGVAVLQWPDRSLTLRATGCDSVHVYVPTHKPFFCVEPQTAPAGALNRNRGEVAVLAPGEKRSMQMQLSVGGS